MVIALQASSALMEAMLLDPSIDCAASADTVRQFVRRRARETHLFSVLVPHPPTFHQGHTPWGLLQLYFSIDCNVGEGKGGGGESLFFKAEWILSRWPLLRLNDHCIWGPQDLTV